MKIRPRWGLTKRQAEIKLDIDGELDTQEVFRLLRRGGYRATAMGIRRSPGGSGWHVNVHVIPTPRHPMEVVALQAILGGDRNREAMQLHRARCFYDVPMWMRNIWNVLYLPDPRRNRHVKINHGE